MYEKRKANIGNIIMLPRDKGFQYLHKNEKYCWYDN